MENSMNRVIKFRAWNPKNKTMINPDYSDWEDFFIEPDGTVSYTFDSGGAYHTYRDRRKIDLILMQFTGLTDKNGKEIYEGDILESFQGSKLIIFYHDGTASFNVKYPNDDDYFRQISNAETSMHLTIIGNIYENEP